MDARFIINDGQHRRAAIIEALEQRPELGHESIAVVFFLDIGQQRCQQMFADLNRHAIRPSRSLGLLYDHRNDKAQLAKLVVMKSDVFRDIVDMERSSLAKRSRKLFTLSAFHNACADLVEGQSSGDVNGDATLAREYWEAVAGSTSLRGAKCVKTACQRVRSARDTYTPTALPCRLWERLGTR